MKTISSLLHRAIRILILVAPLVAAVPCSVHAQSAQFQIPITLEAASGPSHSAVLSLGVSGDGSGGSIMDNTYGVDLGTGFGNYEEFSLPPPPPTPIFDVRFKDIPSRGFPPFPQGLDTGLEGDYRGYFSSAQVDSYLVACQGSDLTANQLRVSWPSNLANYGTAWLLKSQFNLFPEINMLTATETEVNGALASACGILIIKTGAMGTTDVRLVDNLVPRVHSLSQNYPNPFNPSTEIRFSLPRAARVNLTVYNLLGQQVATLVNEVKAAGNYTATFNATGMSSGMYFYRIEADAFSQTRTMVLVK